MAVFPPQAFHLCRHRVLTQRDPCIWRGRGRVARDLAGAAFAADSVAVRVKPGTVARFATANGVADGVPYGLAVGVVRATRSRSRSRSRCGCRCRGRCGCRCRSRCGCRCRSRSGGRNRSWGRLGQSRRAGDDAWQRVGDKALLDRPEAACRYQSRHGNDTCDYDRCDFAIREVCGAVLGGTGAGQLGTRTGVGLG